MLQSHKVPLGGLTQDILHRLRAFGRKVDKMPLHPVGYDGGAVPGPPLLADLYPPRLLLWPILGLAARISGAALECLKSRVQAGGGGRLGSAAHFVGISAEPVQFLVP